MYWPLLTMYSENFGFGLGGCYYWGDLFKPGEGIKKRISRKTKIQASALKEALSGICRNLQIKSLTTQLVHYLLPVPQHVSEICHRDALKTS